MAARKETTETGLPADKWTVGTLHEHTEKMFEVLAKNQTTQMQDLKEMLRERFDAQQIALTKGLTAAEQGVAKALDAAKEATNKAEAAAAAQFDQFRKESNLQVETLANKMEREISRLRDDLKELGSRLDSIIGEGAGHAEGRDQARLDNGQLLALAGFLIATTAVVASLFLK